MEQEPEKIKINETGITLKINFNVVNILLNSFSMLKAKYQLCYLTFKSLRHIMRSSLPKRVHASHGKQQHTPPQ